MSFLVLLKKKKNFRQIGEMGFRSGGDARGSHGAGDGVPGVGSSSVSFTPRLVRSPEEELSHSTTGG